MRNVTFVYNCIEETGNVLRDISCLREEEVDREGVEDSGEIK